MTGISIKSRKRMVTGTLALLCLAAGAAGTAGYFTETEKVTNVFSVGNLEIDLKEPEWNPEDGDGKFMNPGYCVYKNPTVKNMADAANGGNPCYARMKVEILDGKGNLITDKETLDLIKQTIRFDETYKGTFSTTGSGSLIPQGRIPGYFLKDLAGIPMVNPLFKLDTGRSTENVLIYNYEASDGRGILNTGEEATLFTNVVIPAEWTEYEMNRIGDYKLDITAEAIQVSGFASRSQAYEALDTEIAGGGANA